MAEMEREAEASEQKPDGGEKPKKEKPLRLTFKEKMALESLPGEIEALEEKIDRLNACLADPKCYAEKGVSVLAQELEKLEAEYETKVEELLTIEEKVENIDSQ